ncbi:MAG TPA: class I tRNA ligase family protein [Patescibacteria group bacterium]|nr:class I tRNA ligase family protein [Patescibacteria group bacterium]
MVQKYNHKEIESKWQKKWLKEGVYQPNLLNAKKPFYNLMMFPYPSAEGLHAGNMFAFTGSDIYGRYTRMNGFDVLEPIGLDGFGIHSENYALKVGKSPQEHSETSEKNFYRQLTIIGNGFSWDNRLETYDPNYYKWTQWIVLQMFKNGLAYQKSAPVNWCPSCKTVIADEQVIKGECERCQTNVETKQLKQWFFRITDYAERLLEGHKKIKWSERVVVAQKNWIGKKEGINIKYKIKGSNKELEVFTTRPDTNFGATFIVVAPEYAKKYLLDIIPKDKLIEVSKYINKSLNKTEQQRQEEGREKTGVFTGLYAVNRLNDYQMPIWISDFVLMNVGTGVVVGVPGHDIRDFEFANKFGLPIKRVVVGPDKDKSEITKIQQVNESGGTMINSEFLNGLDIYEATKKIMDYLEKKGWGKRITLYHLRDWLISRQRYWGPPIPFIFCEKCQQEGKSYFSIQGKSSKKMLHKDESDWDHAGWWPVDESDLPVELPYLKNYKPKGGEKGPLDDDPKFYETICPYCKSKAKRETDVSDTFVDSSWYFLRYPSVGLKSAIKLPFDREITKKWLPVDLYFGGAEHAVLHLMYARFVTMVLYDLKYITFDEPFPRFFAHGLLIKDGAKMSKSKGNIINPDEYIDRFSADAFRLYLMFIGPIDSSPDFRDTGMEGMHRFVGRFWRLMTDDKVKKIQKNDEEILSIKLHQTIMKVTEDIQNFRYNTAISQLMILINFIEKNGINEKTKRTLCLLFAPFAPHITEEIWQNYFATSSEFTSIHLQPWPKYDSSLVREDKAVIIIQVDGKVRSQITIKNELSKSREGIEKLAKQDEKVRKWIRGNEIKKTIFVPGKLINFVSR